MLGNSSILNEHDTLTALSRRHRSSLQRYFERRVKNRVDIEDLIQEVFSRLARRSDFKNIAFIDGYLFEIAANVFKDHLRFTISRAADRHEEYREEHGGQDFSTERVLIAKESVGQVAMALRELPERVRIAFVLHRFEGLRHPEIAQRLGVSISAVEKYIIRALTFIKARMEEKA